MDADGQAPPASRYPDLPQDPGTGLLLRRQDRLHRAAARGGHPLLPVAAAAVRQESVSGHPEGAVRRQRRAVSGARHPPAPRLLGAPSGGAAELRQRQLHGTGLSAQERDGATGRHRAGYGHHRPLRHRSGAFPPPARRPAPGDQAAGGGAGGRVRQADPGCAGATGGRPRQPRLSARAVWGDQGCGRPRALQLSDRGEQVLEGESVFRPQQPHRHHSGSALLGDLRLHRRRPRLRVLGGTSGPGSRPDPRLVQRL